MRVIPLIAHLKANVPLLNGRVEPTTSLMGPDYDELDEDLPICFVHALEDEDKKNQTMGAVEQEELTRFRLIYVAKNIDLDAEIDPMEDLRDQVKAALLGWTNNGLHGPVEKVSGGVIEVSAQAVYWADVFSFENHLQG